MRFEGTLDAFALPELLHLLDHTAKSGTLHIRGDRRRGSVTVVGGRLSGAESGAGLGHRLVGSGIVGDDELAAAVELCADGPEGVVQALLDLGGLDDDVLSELAREHVVDAVFDLARESAGDFAFTAAVGLRAGVEMSIPVSEIMAELARRSADLDALRTHVPSLEVVIGLAPPPAGDTVVRRDEWAMLALVDGRRTVADIVALTGRGEYAVTRALAGLVERRLVVIGAGETAGAADLVRRQRLLGRLDRTPVPAPPTIPPPPALAPIAPVPSPAAADALEPELLRRAIAAVTSL